MNVSNKNARIEVELLNDFKGSHTFGENCTNSKGEKMYIVYSYGYHFPLFVCKGGQWYFNKDKYSVTTSKHKNQLRPNVENFIELTTQELKEL